MSLKPEHFHDNVMDPPSSSSSLPATATTLPLATLPRQHQPDNARLHHHHQQQQQQQHHHHQQQQHQTRPPSSRIQREDILCCHDLPYAAHVGNRMYVIRLSLYLENHPTASSSTTAVMTVEERFKASMDMVKIIRTKQRGRFLAKTKKGTWKDIGDSLAVKWISLHIKRFFALQQAEQQRTTHNHNQEGTIKTVTTDQQTSTTTPGTSATTTTAITASVVVQRQVRTTRHFWGRHVSLLCYVQKKPARVPCLYFSPISFLFLFWQRSQGRRVSIACRSSSSSKTKHPRRKRCFPLVLEAKHGILYSVVAEVMMMMMLFSVRARYRNWVWYIIRPLPPTLRRPPHQRCVGQNHVVSLWATTTTTTTTTA